MAVTPDQADFSLGQKMSRGSSLKLGANVIVAGRNSFPSSWLSIDDTVLKTISFDEEFTNATDNAGATATKDDNEYYQNNNNNTNAKEKIFFEKDTNFEQVKDHNYSKILDLNTSDQEFCQIESTLIQKTEQVHMELKTILNTTEISICRDDRLNNTVVDSGIEKSMWEDDSLLDRVFNELESSNNENVEATKSECSPLAVSDSFSTLTSPKKIHSEPLDCPSTVPRVQKHSLSPLKENSRPNKKSRTVVPRFCEDAMKDSFYGLPGSVKSLIQRVKGIDELYEWQDECLKLKAIYDRKNLIYALPTSGGKTLVAEILMLKELVANKKNAIFILPFVAIVQEKVRSLAPFALALDFLVEEYAAGNGQYPPRKRRRKHTIYVCTIEKGLGLVNSLIENQRLHEVGMVVVDELHLLGEDGGRGATLEGLLTKIMYTGNNPHIIGMSATIGNLNEIAKFLNAEIYTKDFRPVELKEYVKCEDDIWLVDLEQEEILTDLKKIAYAYSQEALRLDPDKLGGLVMDVVPQDSCLIFCPSRKNCENVSILLTKVLFKSLHNHKKKEKDILIRALKAEGALCEILELTIKFGVAYHHSGLMAEERKLLEEAFRSGTLSVICCTSTLAAGVNLPARRVILRHPYVGNQFLNLSRYKQMIGRAGRAGMKDVGESILICRTNEIPKVKELLTSNMDDCISTLHVEEDRGINNLILSSILLNLATTRSELHKIAGTTLLGIQQKRLNINTNNITDKTITKLIKTRVIKVKQVTNYSEINPNLTVLIQSQDNLKTAQETPRPRKKIVKLSRTTKLEVCKLGRAAMKGCVDLNRAHMLYKDLKSAQNQLVLLDCLHLLYLVTPYDVVDLVKPSGNVYCDVVCNLSPIQMQTARVLGINETVATKLRAGVMPKNVDSNVVNRFYLTLMLNELWNQQTVHIVSTKYQVNRGIVQNLMNASASFASSVERFCAELDEFWAFRDLLHSFSKRLSHCCSVELEPLIELPSVKIGRARQLFNAGYKTLQSVALGQPMEMCDKIENLPMRVASQIVAAAKLLLLEKVENLRDEAEDVLDGIDISNFR
ncbi:helicase POLQ-like isoform X1 [Neodiprion fabricii]|uniref:helicase POLQ-like isoform X1 n=1 Tax=Neodiprion fabricii TaxID=2872261 RepID=UPI001ED92BDF|nr:helicase POLQ-like isoform X1 [Neodiprion fabricii]